jgi:hypothetical protein
MANPYILTPQLASGYLNNEDNTIVGKTATGSPVNLPAQAYGGQLGKLLVIDDAEASRLSKTTIGTLRAGTYMLVKTKAASSAAPARGIAAFWDTSANGGLGSSVVTPDIAATSSLAGIYINAPTKGNYCWIQVFGLATLQCRSSVTTTTIGDIAVLTGLTTNTFDSIADATDYFSSAGTMKLLVGQWYEAPANSGLKLAWLNGFAVRRYAI